MKYDDVKNAWKQYEKHGSADIGGGLCLETGAELKKWGTEGLEDDYCYLTTDDGQDPIEIIGFADLLDELKEQLPYTIDDDMEVIIENERTCSRREWHEACQAITDVLYDWRGEDYHDDDQEYRGELDLDGMRFAYSMPAWINEENGSLMFDGPVRIKRIR